MLVAYDLCWPRLFEEAAEQLRQLGRSSWRIEHIGSTAIPGMPAKPIIDLAVKVADHAEFVGHRCGLEAGGWQLGSSVRTHPVMLREVGGQRTHIAHFFTCADWEVVNQRIFRDWLVDHPEDAARYAHAKQVAAADALAGRSSYNAGKTAAIQQILDRARAARGLAPAEASDK